MCHPNTVLQCTITNWMSHNLFVILNTRSWHRPHKLRTQSHKTSSSSDSSHHQVPRLPTLLPVNLRAPMIPTTLFSNPLKQLKNSGKCYTYDYNFIIKDIMQEQRNKRKRCIEEVMMGVKGGVGELGVS